SKGRFAADQVTCGHLALTTSVVGPVSAKAIFVFSGKDGLPSTILASQLSASGCTSDCLPGTTLRMQWRSLPSTSVQGAVTWNKAFLSLVTALPLGPVTSLSMSTVVVGITRLWISTAVTSLGSMVATGSSTESELMT